MPQDLDRFFVITGGPGSGKTTLLDALAAAGFATLPEAGRAIIRDQLAIGGSALPWSHPELFAELMLSWDLRSYRSARSEQGPVFFDRSVVDLIGYLRLSGIGVPRHFRKAAETLRYRRRVFVAPPWPEIFAQDSERKQSLEEARKTFDAVAEAYEELGYELVPLPLAPVGERRDFVLREAGLLLPSPSTFA